MARNETPVYELIEEMAADFARQVVGIIREAPLDEVMDLLADARDGAAEAQPPERGETEGIGP